MNGMEIRMIKIKRTRLILFTFFVVLILISSIVKNNVTYCILGGISVVLLSSVAYNFRKITSLFICFFFIAYSTYSILMGVYLFPNIRPYFFQQFTDDSVYRIGIQCIYIFALSLWFLTNLRDTEVECSVNCLYNDDDINKKNSIVALLCAFITILIICMNFSFGNSGERATNTSLYEYKIIFCIVGMLYSGNSKLLKYMWEILILFSCLLSFAGGNRADAIPLIIALIYFYYNNTDFRKTIIIIVMGIFSMVAIGAFRETIIQGGFDLQIIIRKIVEEKFTFDTAYWAYIPALASISVAKIIPMSEKIKLIGGQILYILGGGRFNEYRLEFYVKKYFNHVNGFVSPVYFYMWFGLFGAVLFAILVYYCIEKTTFKKKKQLEKWKRNIIQCLSVYYISSVPRWYLYDPFGLIRGGMIMTITCFLFICFDEMITPKARII